MMTTKKIILSSGSPRRKELMEQMGLDFTVDTATSFEEIVPVGSDGKTPAVAPENVPAFFAEGKSLGFHRPLSPDEVLVTADTIVICDGVIMGKPHDAGSAGEMLRHLSGKSHEVVSAVCVRTAEGHKTVSDSATVTFRELSENEIEYYISNYKPFDKAGAYGIQEWIGLVGITSIEGSFYTIMGLPTHLLSELLRR